MYTLVSISWGGGNNYGQQFNQYQQTNNRLTLNHRTQKLTTTYEVGNPGNN